MHELVKPLEVAKQLGVSPATLARWRTLGSGPRFVRVGGQVRYQRDAVAAWLTQQERSSTAAVAMTA